jgi:hypothetical protein
MNASWIFRSILTFLLRPRHLQHVGLSLLVMGSMLFSLVAYPDPAFAQTPSEGCDLMNESRWDGFYNSTGTFLVAFSAGEHLVLTTSEPQDFGPNTYFVFVFGDTVLEQSFPGTIEYTVPQDTSVSIYWQVFSGNVTWNVSCTPAEPPTPTNPEQCKQGGYRDFIDPQTGAPFKSQGQCIAYVNSQP